MAIFGILDRPILLFKETVGIAVKSFDVISEVFDRNVFGSYRKFS